jgi:hypothetical protein
MARRPRRRVLPALIPGPSDQPPPIQPAAFGMSGSVETAANIASRVRRRGAVLEQSPQPLLLADPGVHDAPAVAGGGRPPIVPPRDGDTAGASSPDASATFAGEGAFGADATVDRRSSPVAESIPPRKKPRVTSSAARTRRTQSAPARPKRDVITNPAEVIRHSQILIIALQEALDYDPV